MRQFLSLLFVVGMTGVAAAQTAQSQYQALYVQLGRYAGVSSIAQDLVNRLAADPKIAPLFANVSAAQRTQLAKYAADSACATVGEQCTPVVPDIPALRERRLVLSRSQSHAAIADLRTVLDAHRVPPQAQRELLGFLEQR